MRRWYSRFSRCCAARCRRLPAAAQDYPNRPIRVIASQGAGRPERRLDARGCRRAGPAFSAARVVVEDRAGAAGSIGARACAESAPDGYTICILPTEAMVINPVINPIAGFDPRKASRRSPRRST